MTSCALLALHHRTQYSCTLHRSHDVMLAQHATHNQDMSCQCRASQWLSRQLKSVLSQHCFHPVWKQKPSRGTAFKNSSYSCKSAASRIPVLLYTCVHNVSIACTQQLMQQSTLTPVLEYDGIHRRRLFSLKTIAPLGLVAFENCCRESDAGSTTNARRRPCSASGSTRVFVNICKAATYIDVKVKACSLASACTHSWATQIDV
eukprot:1231458-Amphidinium_carterae.3